MPPAISRTPASHPSTFSPTEAAEAARDAFEHTKLLTASAQGLNRATIMSSHLRSAAEIRSSHDAEQVPVTPPTPHGAMSHCTTQSHAIPRYAMPSHAMPCRTMPHHTSHNMPRYTLSLHTIRPHTMARHTIPYDASQRHAIPHHTTPHHTTPHHATPTHYQAFLQGLCADLEARRFLDDVSSLSLRQLDSLRSTGASVLQQRMPHERWATSDAERERRKL